MNSGFRRLRGTLGVGLTWAVGWAVTGILIGVSSLLLPGLPWDAFFSVYDAPLPTLAVPGFFGGVLYATILQIVARRRRFEDLSVPLVAVAGAAGGFLLSLIPASMIATGLATVEGGRFGILPLTLMLVVPFTALSAVSAAASFLVARRANRDASSQVMRDNALGSATAASATSIGEGGAAFIKHSGAISDTEYVEDEQSRRH